jgi:hypothetical protein
MRHGRGEQQGPMVLACEVVRAAKNVTAARTRFVIGYPQFNTISHIVMRRARELPACRAAEVMLA